MPKFRIKEVYNFSQQIEMIYDCEADEVAYHGDFPENIKNKVVLSEKVIGTDTDGNELIYVVPIEELELQSKKEKKK